MGLNKPPPKRTIKEYELFQLFVKSEPSHQGSEVEKTRSKSKFQYIPSVLSIIISFIGWSLEANEPTLSINFCNFVCLLIFLPLYIFCDAEIFSPEKGTHSKDIQLLEIEQKPSQKNFEQEPHRYDVVFESNFVREKFESYTQQYFDTFFKQFFDASKTLILIKGRVCAVNTEFVQEGDIVVLREGEELCFDCQLLPVYLAEDFTQLDLKSVYSGGRSFGQGTSPTVESSLNKQLYQRLHNYCCYERGHEYGLGTSETRISQPSENKNIHQRDCSKSGCEADTDCVFAGYTINCISNDHDIYWNDIDVAQLLNGFLTQNEIEDEEIAEQINPGEVVLRYMEKHHNILTYQKDNKLYLEVVIARGCYAVCTATMFRSKIVEEFTSKPAEGVRLNGDAIEESAKYTFFSHLESLGKSLKILPATLALSLLIIVAPHIPRLIILSDYHTVFLLAFKAQKWPDMLFHGFIPTMCASLSFWLCTLQFAHHVATLLRPMLKSASAYVKILQKRMMLIPSLGSLESLGFTNAIVVQDTNLFVPRYELSICAIGMNNYGNMKVFNAHEAAAQVFKNRLRKPLLVFPTENDKSYWICFIRLITALSLENEEIANILLQKSATANYHHNIYNPNYNGPSYVDAGQINEQNLEIINEQRNMTFEMTEQLSNFKAGQYLDFSELIQPSCLLEANLSVTQLHPLQTKPFLVFYANLPIHQLKNMIIVRASSCKNIVSICSNILTTSNIDINSSSEEFSQDEHAINVPFLLMRLGREVNQRELREKDIEKLLQIDADCYKKCYHVEHYAICLVGGEEHYSSVHEMFDQRKFTYLFHISFQPEVERYAANFVRRFEKGYNGINLFITTKLNASQCLPLMRAFNLQLNTPKKFEQPEEAEDIISEENVSFEYDGNIIAKAITQKQRRLMNTHNSEASEQDQELCQLVANSMSDVLLIKEYILSRNILEKEHIIEQKEKKSVKKAKEQEARISSTTEAEGLLDQAEMMEIDYDDSLSESEILREEQIVPAKEKRHRRRKPKAQEETSLFLVTGVHDSLGFAKMLYDSGLFVSWISDEAGPEYNLSEVTILNAKVENSLKPDFLIINSEEQPSASKSAVHRIIESARVSICSIRGKYALERLLDACEEIPFYFMTLSPVFLGTIRSRELVGLLPIFILLSIIIIEVAACFIHETDAEYINQLQIRPFFMPPVAVGIILMFSMIYIELLLPLIIWTPPSATALTELENRHPNYVGNRAAMLYDFNKLLPQKTSSRALLIFSAVFTFLSVFVIIPALEFYSGFGEFEDDFISVQLLKLSPFVSLFYCMIFTSFATGALIISNKLPLGKVWGQTLPKTIYFKKALIFILLYLFALIFIFVLPTATHNLSLLVLGFQIDWIDNNYLQCVLIGFVVAIMESIGVILEEALFVRIN